MSKRGEKLLDRMRHNPADWRIEVCESFGLDIDRRPNGSHYGISDSSQALHVTVPLARPIKRVYIRQLVRFVDTVQAARKEVRDGLLE